MAKKVSCELCSNPARMFCESDQASLCWDCDHKVHTANFLVAKHSRTLLCHVCNSPTAWTAAGLNLGPTVSLCRTCAEHPIRGEEESQEMSESDDYYSSEDEEEEEGENQVVPLATEDDEVEESASSSSFNKKGAVHQTIWIPCCVKDQID